MITVREKLFDLFPNSLNWFLKEMYGDKSGECMLLLGFIIPPSQLRAGCIRCDL